MGSCLSISIFWPWDRSDWEGPHGKLVWQDVCKSPPVADLIPSPTSSSLGPQNAVGLAARDAVGTGVMWQRVDQTGAHIKAVVSFPLTVLIHSVLSLFWWK